MKLKVAMLQLMPGSNIQENLEKGIKYCVLAKEEGADIVLFPEMWSVGYRIPDDLSLLKSLSVSSDSDFVNNFKNLAQELDIAIGITYLEKYDPLPKNTISLFDRFGNLVYKYSKVHTCDFGDEVRLTPGDDFYVGSLNTKEGNVLVGSMICYDREFPESARILMLKGAEIILVPNACPLEINRISQLRGRAYENMLGIVTVNYPEGFPDCNGHSNAFDGVAYLPNLSGSRDTMLIDAGPDEGMYIVEFDIDMLRKYRTTEVHGDCYRRPNKYKLLTEDNKQKPFIRNNFRK